MNKVKTRTRTFKPNPENATPISSSPNPDPNLHPYPPPRSTSAGQWVDVPNKVHQGQVVVSSHPSHVFTVRFDTEEKTQPLIETGEFELIPGGTNSAGETELDESVFELLESSGEEENAIVEKEWKPPELKPKRSQTGVKMEEEKKMGNIIR